MESLKPYEENRPWGKFIEFTHNKPSTVKIIEVSPNQELSLQYHEKRDEFWHVISGSGTLEIGTNKFEAVPGENHFVPRETKHRIGAGDTPLLILEISLGDFDENDIVRIEDRYGRV